MLTSSPEDGDVVEAKLGAEDFDGLAGTLIKGFCSGELDREDGAALAEEVDAGITSVILFGNCAAAVDLDPPAGLDAGAGRGPAR